jgi:hypothetical protein
MENRTLSEKLKLPLSLDENDFGINTILYVRDADGCTLCIKQGQKSEYIDGYRHDLERIIDAVHECDRLRPIVQALAKQRCFCAMEENEDCGDCLACAARAALNTPHPLS